MEKRCEKQKATLQQSFAAGEEKAEKKAYRNCVNPFEFVYFEMQSNFSIVTWDIHGKFLLLGKESEKKGLDINRTTLHSKRKEN